MGTVPPSPVRRRLHRVRNLHSGGLSALTDLSQSNHADTSPEQLFQRSPRNQSVGVFPASKLRCYQDKLQLRLGQTIPIIKHLFRRFCESGMSYTTLKTTAACEGSFLTTPSRSRRGIKSVPFFLTAQPLESGSSTGAHARSVTLSLRSQAQTGTNTTPGSRSSDSSPGEIPRRISFAEDKQLCQEPRTPASTPRSPCAPRTRPSEAREPQRS